jgi:hypothetical protein
MLELSPGKQHALVREHIVSVLRKEMAELTG